MLRFFKNIYRAATIVLVLFIIFSCKKTPKLIEPPIIPPIGGVDTIIKPAIDPAIANTIGFFLDDWQAKTFVAPAYAETAIPSSTTNTVTIDATAVITKIPLSEFGNNAVWWMGPVAGDPKFIEPVTNLHPHIIRFPGGSSSNAYFWNAAQGAKPADAPEMALNKDGAIVNPNYNYGKTTVNWQCNLNDYYALLQQTNSKGIITVNYSYARYGTSANPAAVAAHLAADWVRFDNGRTKFWEIGNENYGDWELGYRIDVSANKDGQSEYLTGELYAKHFKIFVDSMQKAAMEIGSKIYIGAVTAEDASTETWQTNTRKTWNAGMMPGIDNKADFFVVHNYFTPYKTNDNAALIFSTALTVPQTMMQFVTKTLQSYGNTVKPIVMDEWNITSSGQKQQVSNTSGVFAVLVIGEALKNKYGMSARWDLLNSWENGNDHGMFSAGDEPGGIAKWSPRPSFYYLYYLQKMLGDRLVNATVTGSDNVKAYASTYTAGQVNVTLINTGATPQTVEVKMKNFYSGNRFYWYNLEGGDDNGEFSRKVLVNGNGPAGDAGGPATYATIKAQSAITANGIKVTIPALGATFLVLDKK